MTLSAEAKAIRQKVDVKSKVISSLLNATTTTQDIELAIVGQKITVQADGDLTYTILISINGENYLAGAVITTTSANEIASYTTHLVSNIRITRTGGSGKVTILVI